MLRYLINKVLASPAVFDLQQRVCNSYKNVITEFTQHLDVKGKNILEVGCSTGVFARTEINMKDNNYFGIDIIAKYIKFAKKNSLFANFHCMDARKMEFEDEKFDVVIFNGVMHHMEDELIADCLNDVKRVLKSDGVVLVAEPVFTPNKLISNLLLSLDRGKYIRSQEGYAKLFSGFQVAREGFFDFSCHRFCSFVLGK